MLTIIYCDIVNISFITCDDSLDPLFPRFYLTFLPSTPLLLKSCFIEDFPQELTFSGWRGGISEMRKAICFTRSLPGRHARASRDCNDWGSARWLCCVSLQMPPSKRRFSGWSPRVLPMLRDNGGAPKQKGATRRLDCWNRSIEAKPGSSIESIEMPVNGWQDLLCPKQAFK